jgi:hypothetical protein
MNRSLHDRVLLGQETWLARLDQILDIVVNATPMAVTSRQKFHLGHSHVTFVELLQHAALDRCWNYGADAEACTEYFWLSMSGAALPSNRAIYSDCSSGLNWVSRCSSAFVIEKASTCRI